MGHQMGHNGTRARICLGRFHYNAGPCRTLQQSQELSRKVTFERDTLGHDGTQNGTQHGTHNGTQNGTQYGPWTQQHGTLNGDKMTHNGTQAGTRNGSQMGK